MPNPIVPIHKQEDFDDMFGGSVEISGLSDIQQTILGPRTAAKKTYSSQTEKKLANQVYYENPLIQKKLDDILFDESRLYKQLIKNVYEVGE